MHASDVLSPVVSPAAPIIVTVSKPEHVAPPDVAPPAAAGRAQQARVAALAAPLAAPVAVGQDSDVWDPDDDHELSGVDGRDHRRSNDRLRRPFGSSSGGPKRSRKDRIKDRGYYG
jgi:hypothetical protein